MALTVSIKINRSFDVQCEYEKVFGVLADVPRSVSHFPKVEQLVDMGDNTFRWEMAKLGVDKYYFQTVYACKYTDNIDEGWVKWVAVKGVGNGIVEGSWQMKAENGGTHIDFFTKGDLNIPVSSLVKFIVSPLVVHEFEGLINKYLENLKETFRTL